MQLDPLRVADTKSWLRRVQDDVRAAEIDLAADPALLGDAAFHCQQIIEKALKAFLTWHDIPFRKTHDLESLGLQCASLDPALGTICQPAESLTAYAWTFRYPVEREEPQRAEIDQALELAREIHAAVLARLPEEVRD